MRIQLLRAIWEMDDLDSFQSRLSNGHGMGLILLVGNKERSSFWNHITSFWIVCKNLERRCLPYLMNGSKPTLINNITEEERLGLWFQEASRRQALPLGNSLHLKNLHSSFQMKCRFFLYLLLVHTSSLINFVAATHSIWKCFCTWKLQPAQTAMVHLQVGVTIMCT